MLPPARRDLRMSLTISGPGPWAGEPTGGDGPPGGGLGRRSPDPHCLSGTLDKTLAAIVLQAKENGRPQRGLPFLSRRTLSVKRNGLSARSPAGPKP